MSHAARAPAPRWGDVPDGAVQTHAFGAGRFGSEAPFAPRAGATGEDEGYLVSFGTDERERRSHVEILRRARPHSGGVGGGTAAWAEPWSAGRSSTLPRQRPRFSTTDQG